MDRLNSRRFRGMIQTNLEVPEVTCGHCVEAIEGAVGALHGVKSVKVDLDQKDVTVNYDESVVELGAIIIAIEGEGYGVGAEAQGPAPVLHQIGSGPGTG
jgi:copper chaperone